MTTSLKYAQNKPDSISSTKRIKRLLQTGTGNLYCLHKGIEAREAFFAGEKQYGLYAVEFLPKGTIVYEADPQESETKSYTRATIDALDDNLRKRYWVYIWQLDEDRFSGPRLDMPLDEALHRDAVNYLNHCCDPSVGYDGDDCLITLRDIYPGEMICYDYAMSETDPEGFPEFECECGASNCRGVIKPTDFLIPDVYTRYKGRFLGFVSRKLKELGIY